MTPKEKILAFVRRFDERLTMDEVLYKLDLFSGVEISLQQAERGQVIDHDELFERLLNDGPKNSRSLVPARRAKPAEHKGAHRPKRSKNSSTVHKATKRVR